MTVNVGLGVASLVDNVRGGHYGVAALDVGGLLYDGFATAVPVLPGGASTAIKAARAGKAAATAVRGADGALALRSFTRRNFRYNVAKATGGVVEGAHAHHVLPVMFKAEFKAAGIDVNNPKYGAWWAGSDHLKNAAAYNQEWADFFKKHSSPTEAQIMEMAGKLSGKHGLKFNH